MGGTSTLIKEKGVKFQRNEPGNHRAQALVERVSRSLAERLFSDHYAMNSATKKFKAGEVKVYSSNVKYKRPVGLSEKKFNT